MHLSIWLSLFSTVNNAGVTLFSIFECTSIELMKKLFEVNYFGTVRLTKAVLPFMKAKESGHIINMSSHGGVVGFPCAEICCSSKFAVEGLTESLAPSLRQFNIRYFSIAPNNGRLSIERGEKRAGNGKIICINVALRRYTIQKVSWIPRTLKTDNQKCAVRDKQAQEPTNNQSKQQKVHNKL